MTSQAYRNAIGEEMKRTGLDTIDKATRSYLMKIMDNLSDVEEWLAQRPNPDRLSHPKTIWKVFDADMNRPWPSPGVEDPGGDPDDQEEYWGQDGDSDPEQERRAESEETHDADQAQDYATDKDDEEEEDEQRRADPNKPKKAKPCPRLSNTIGDRKRFIDQAIAQGAKHNNLCFIQIVATDGYDEHHPVIAGVETSL